MPDIRRPGECEGPTRISTEPTPSPCKSGPRLLLDLTGHGRVPGTELETEANQVFLHLKVPDDPEGDDVACESGVLHRLEHLKNVLFGHAHEESSALRKAESRVVLP